MFLREVDLIPTVDELDMPVIAVLAFLFQKAYAFVPAAVAGANRYLNADRRGVDRRTRLDDNQSRTIVTSHNRFALMLADHTRCRKRCPFRESRKYPIRTLLIVPGRNNVQ